MIGIPYAKQRVVRGVLLNECPVCQCLVAEDTDATGESITKNYARHYIAKHGEEAEQE